MDDPAKPRARRRADITRMAEMRRRIISYVKEMDKVNEELIKLYYDTEKADAKKNIRKKVDSISLAAARRGYKSQKRDYIRIKKMRIPETQKERIFEIM